jgi:hypothetical protein
MLREIIIFPLIIVAVVAGTAFSDAIVVQSGSPTFPLQVDKVTLSAVRVTKKKSDTVSAVLPVSLYADFRDNVDTMLTYADALRLRRPELSGGNARYVLTFEYMGLCVMQVFFRGKRLSSGKLVAAVDRYPFVVILTRGFSARMEKLMRAGPK